MLAAACRASGTTGIFGSSLNESSISRLASGGGSSLILLTLALPRALYLGQVADAVGGEDRLEEGVRVQLTSWCRRKAS